MSNLRAVKNVTFLKVILKKIRLAKELFLIDIEQGHESFIPKELSQDNLPYSMRFYDPIMQIIQDKISEERKVYFYNQTKQNWLNNYNSLENRFQLKFQN